VTERAKRERQSRKKGKCGQRVKLVRGIVREVAGYAPYERRMMEIIKGGGNNPQKRCWKFAKNRLGTHVRAKRKVAEIVDVVALLAKQSAAEKAAASKAE
jgi:large subunit ribosomal protein L36e